MMPLSRQATLAFTQRFSWAMLVYTPGLPYRALLYSTSQSSPTGSWQGQTVGELECIAQTMQLTSLLDIESLLGHGINQQYRQQRRLTRHQANGSVVGAAGSPGRKQGAAYMEGRGVAGGSQ